MKEIFLDDYIQNAQGNFIATLSNEKEIIIPKKDIDTFITKGKMKEIDAIEMWLADNDYLESEEQNELSEKAKDNKINHNARAEKKKDSKPRTVKISDEKQALFENVYNNLKTIYGEQAEIIKMNKLIMVNIGDKHFKIDLIEQRQKKK